MRFILKQVRFYFPFVFPMMWIDAGQEGFLVKNYVENKSEIIALKKQVEELIARVEVLEENVFVNHEESEDDVADDFYDFK